MTDKRIPALQKHAKSTGRVNATFIGGPLKNFDTDDVSLRYFPRPTPSIPASWSVSGQSELQDGFYVGFTFSFHADVFSGEHGLPADKLDVYCVRLPEGGGVFYEYNVIKGTVEFTLDEQSKRIHGSTSCRLVGSDDIPFDLSAVFNVEGIDAVFHRLHASRQKV
ncbi:hypothetical protein [Pseudomonas mandelii]|jgi:hypothetical protein|uniref:hypothetical protein n=1 Tax=Pseudomonas mandelii TaxID=75612 RepID=UPI003C794FA4